MCSALNEYLYEQISPGQAESFTVTISGQLQELFLKMSGDVNPMHSDAEFARQKGFDAPIAFGMLVASFYSTLVGTYLPGKHCLFQEADIKFVSPVYIGDTLQITGTVYEKDDRFKRITINARIRNQDGKTVSRAILKVGVLSE